LVGFTFEELNAARRTARVSATGVQLVDPRILLQGEHKPLSFLQLVLASTFDSQIWH
jgi:hypothetical protein